MKKEAKTSERKEAFLRIFIGIISWIVIGVWQYLIYVVAVLNWFIVLFVGKKNKKLAVFAEYWNTESYKLTRYLTFVSNKRPFPFSDPERMSKVE